ncbi:hypothetical protein KP509_01G053700 [Ceratopteris richardii]|uniref:Uncharacterized protein n=1 Tax=Ceratopteris richardii TaxID=49495 RepID=A0A8T2VLC7_CERRI|nr:hypothetical protein KP509_01G053700 [Ceratopteris richardii]
MHNFTCDMCNVHITNTSEPWLALMHSQLSVQVSRRCELRQLHQASKYVGPVCGITGCNISTLYSHLQCSVQNSDVRGALEIQSLISSSSLSLTTAIDSILIRLFAYNRKLSEARQAAISGPNAFAWSAIIDAH